MFKINIPSGLVFFCQSSVTGIFLSLSFFKKFFIYTAFLLCFSACTTDTDDSGGAKPDPAKHAGISPEEKAKLEAKEKELIAKAQQNPETSASSPTPSGQSIPSLSGALSGIPNNCCNM